MRAWPKGEKLPGFFERMPKPAWLARNMSAWEHLRHQRTPLDTTGHKTLQPKPEAR